MGNDEAFCPIATMHSSQLHVMKYWGNSLVHWAPSFIIRRDRKLDYNSQNPTVLIGILVTLCMWSIQAHVL